MMASIPAQDTFFANVDKGASDGLLRERLQPIAMDLLGWKSTDEIDTVSISPSSCSLTLIPLLFRCDRQ